jgi:hypothetical protein
MTRRMFIERFLIQIYGGFQEDDAEMTYDLINGWLPDAIATAAKQNYKEAIQIDGIGYVNNSFYTTFSGIPITSDSTDNLLFKISLPDIPIGIGRSDGLAEVRFKDAAGNTSQPAVPVSINQWSYIEGMRRIPNKILILSEGNQVRIKSPYILSAPSNPYTATVKMISGGDATNLDSELNVPSDYFPVMQDYLKVQLGFEKAQKPDVVSDGNDMP